MALHGTSQFAMVLLEEVPHKGMSLLKEATWNKVLAPTCNQMVPGSFSRAYSMHQVLLTLSLPTEARHMQLRALQYIREAPKHPHCPTALLTFLVAARPLLKPTVFESHKSQGTTPLGCHPAEKTLCQAPHL